MDGIADIVRLIGEAHEAVEQGLKRVARRAQKLDFESLFVVCVLQFHAGSFTKNDSRSEPTSREESLSKCIGNVAPEISSYVVIPNEERLREIPECAWCDSLIGAKHLRTSP